MVAGINLRKLHVSGGSIAHQINALPTHLPHLQEIQIHYIAGSFVHLLDVLVIETNLACLQTLCIAVVEVPANLQQEYRKLQDVCRKRNIVLCVGGTYAVTAVADYRSHARALLVACPKASSRVKVFGCVRQIDVSGESWRSKRLRRFALTLVHFCESWKQSAAARCLPITQPCSGVVM